MRDENLKGLLLLLRDNDSCMREIDLSVSDELDIVLFNKLWSACGAYGPPVARLVQMYEG